MTKTINRKKLNFDDRILGWKEVRTTTGLSRTGVWRLIKNGKFPQARQLSPNRVGWIRGEILEWVHTRPKAEEGSNE